MSYILDALRKADAERERGNVPGLHAQPMPAVTAPGAHTWLRRSLWLGAAVAAAAVAMIGWRLLRPAPPPTAPLQVAQAPQPLASPAPAPAAVANPAAPPLNVPPPSPSAPVAESPAKAAPVARPKDKPRDKPAGREAVPPKPPASEKSAPAAPPPAPADLPPIANAGLSKLTVNGSVYSENASQRMLVVNGQVFNEGNTLAPDAVLERIGQRSATVNVRGTRYRLDY